MAGFTATPTQEYGACNRVSRKYSYFNISAPGANTGIITNGVKFTESAGVCRVAVALTTSSVFNVTCYDGTTTHKWGMQQSAPLNAGDMYVFYFPVAAYDTGLNTGNALTYNFEVETDGVIEHLIVDEVIGAVV